ncbi:MAG TPA: MotA/TolQ/ExbB proton channel family protein [Candidatus Acidoferrales bacterium]|nr:MotA/TolQ/ExbB proton channel family protein [Candidatus Acidoferrales bacterium]
MTPLLGILLVGQLGPLIEQTGWVARVVLLLLFTFSLVSWAVIFQKANLFSMLNRHTERFLTEFRSRKKLNDPKPMTASASPLVAVYSAGVREVESQLADASPQGARIRSQNAVLASMQGAAQGEVRKLEKWMPWLATTGSVAPFIGLFGTVWGIIDAFSGLGEAGAASLRAVAPGIAEALITTAAGLFAAIPAVIAYNYFLHSIKNLGAQMDTFTNEFLALVEKTYG